MKNQQKLDVTVKRTNFSFVSLRLIGAALALLQVELTAASITPLPGVGRFVVVGRPVVHAHPFINMRPPVREHTLVDLDVVDSEGRHHD